MAHRRRSAATATIAEGFTLSPLPWPVLLILAVAFIFLGISWFLSYESAMEVAEEQMGWILLAVPLLLILLAQWVSTIESPESYLGWGDNRRRRYRQPPSEGGSPWGVAAVILLLLVLMQFQSSFLESWF
ncbi:hypothetical protein SAY86_014286 [Trapa natans]|uniref:Transmembrane protein n=1 Tax=Trapa natans TaxID=22666 RepID=A0AAN7KT05_TRANT|nr:hypothetical protein SAY86_014286 [Trapa natans]